MEDMNAALSDGILSWTTSHFSTFEVVAYDGDCRGYIPDYERWNHLCLFRFLFMMP